MIKTTKLYLHDIELEVKNVPVNHGAQVRQTIKTLRLQSKALLVSREVGFHQVNSVPFERFKAKFKDTVSVEYTSHNDEGESDVMMFESFSEKKLEQAVSEYRKLRWDKFFFFEHQNLSNAQIVTLKEIYESRAEFIALGETWLERLLLMYDSEKEEGVSAILSSKLEEKHFLKQEVTKKIATYTVCKLEISSFEYSLLQIRQDSQTALESILKPGKCLASVEQVSQKSETGQEQMRYAIHLRGFRAVKKIKDQINETLDRILREAIKLNLQEYIERHPILSLKIDKLKEKIPQFESRHQVVLTHFFTDGIKKIELYGPLQRIEACERSILKYIEDQHPIEVLLKAKDELHLQVITQYLKELNRLYTYELLFNASQKELTIEIYSCNKNLSKAEVKQLLVMLDQDSLPKLLQKELILDSEVLNQLTQSQKLREKLEDGTSGFLNIQFEGESLQLSSYKKEDLDKFEKKLNFYIYSERLQYFEIPTTASELQILKFLIEHKEEIAQKPWIPNIQWMRFVKLVEEKNGDEQAKFTILMYCTLAQRDQISDQFYHALRTLKIKQIELSKLEAQLLKIIDEDSRVSATQALFERMPVYYKQEIGRSSLLVLCSGDELDRMMSSKFKNKLLELKQNYSTVDMQSAMKFNIFMDFDDLPRYSSAMNGVFSLEIVNSREAKQQRQIRFYGKNAPLFQFYRLSMDNAIQHNLGILQDYKLARLHFKHLKNKIPSVESTMQCEIMMAMQERAPKPSVFHFHIHKPQISRQEFQDMKAEIGKMLQNRLQNLDIQKWILLIPLHIMRTFQTLYERQQYPLEYEVVSRAQNNPLWLVQKKKLSSGSAEESKEDLDQKWKNIADSDQQFHQMLQKRFLSGQLKYTFPQGGATLQIETESNDMSDWVIKRFKTEEITSLEGESETVQNVSQMALRRQLGCIQVSFVKKHLARHSYQKQLKNCLIYKNLCSHNLRVLELACPLRGLDKTFIETKFCVRVNQSERGVQTIDYLSIEEELLRENQEFQKEQELFLTELRTWLDMHQREGRQFWETLGQRFEQCILKVVRVDLASEEGKLVQGAFKESIDNASVLSVQRVQDFARWNKFQEFKKKSHSEERQLFVATLNQSPQEIFLRPQLLQNRAQKMIITNDGDLLRKYAFYSSENCWIIVLARVAKGQFNLVQNSIEAAQTTSAQDWGSEVSCINVESEEHGDAFLVKQEEQIYPEYIVSFK